MTEYSNLSESELQAVINNAESALKEKKTKKRKQVISQIKELAASIGVTVIINQGAEAKVKTVKKVAAKYCHPNDKTQAWTGRGVSPKWMQALLEAGHDKSEFLIS